jgi:redox-sensitive bicupin YhaK (pirin superfamily)
MQISKLWNLKIIYTTRFLSTMASVIKAESQAFQLTTENPFIFAVRHLDLYPKGSGNEHLGLYDESLLEGRDLGMDFTLKDGWRYYHGSKKPGFPQHPHRGFETLTLVRSGVIDHSDSLGAKARFGNGDAQWMTAGRGISHSEMFPLLNTTSNNTCELFQLWINLPKKSKMVDPFFKMLWAEDIPTFHLDNGNVQVTVVAQSTKEPLEFADKNPPSPPPNSYAADPNSYLSVWTIKINPGGKFTLPKTVEGANRNLYLFLGSITIAEKNFTSEPVKKIKLTPTDVVQLVNSGKEPAEMLYLSAKPIPEPVVQQGPFVGSSREDIIRAYQDYQRGTFGKWPFDSDEPVHGKDEGRFALYPDGKRVVPQTKVSQRDEL